ncbi:unnamed protein product [Acanthoscelides obtectus]|nr:unnamed protein product [Acanthoscelides obtectus]CAH2001928.1 unnamed protein product [Acanthoscelides obtectus]CAK1669109.1 Protein PET117 homolog, mitochondrial [Acanthoscelides obtectus]CAK1670163.1 Protein PET117 homolog, mitochondrial [Acanthoscelides obtectus]
MSLQAKICLGAACVFSASIIGYVHIKQIRDREAMHEGVIRDIEMRQRKKAENLYTLQQQIDLAKELKKHNGHSVT